VWRARAVFATRLTWHVVTFALLSTTAMAQRSPSASELERAAAAFDAGVEAFERSHYANAVRRFLEADALAPNTDALWNALAAAERAKNDALVATVAARVAASDARAPKLAARARKALEDVEPRVAKLVLSCAPEPCELALDGDAVRPGTSYALPGKRVVSATGPNDARAEQALDAVAGTSHTLTLAVESVARPAVSVPSAERPSHPTLTRLPQPAEHDAEPPLSPPIFYAGLGLTVALATATTWSGIDTLRAKERLPGTESDNADVIARAHRTDALLLGTVVVGAATAYVGLALTNWGPPGSQTSFAAHLVEGGAVVSLTGTR
jgi:hypothetical protein